MHHLVDANSQQSNFIKLELTHHRFIGRPAAGTMQRRQTAGQRNLGALDKVAGKLVVRHRCQRRNQAQQLRRRPLDKLAGRLAARVLLDMSAFGVRRVAVDAGKLKRLAVCCAAMRIADDVDRIVRCNGIDQFLAPLGVDPRRPTSSRAAPASAVPDSASSPRRSPGRGAPLPACARPMPTHRYWPGYPECAGRARARRTECGCVRRGGPERPSGLRGRRRTSADRHTAERRAHHRT